MEITNVKTRNKEPE